MLNASEMIQNIGVLPIINIRKEEWVEPLAQTLLKTGIPAIEVLLRNPRALEFLALMKKSHPEMAVGAGTVLTLEQAKEAQKAGADFIVSPGYDQQIVDWCREQGLLAVPGCADASTIQRAYVSGLRVVKFFPSEPLGGLKIIRQYADAFSGMKFLPTNGMNLDNIGTYLQADCIAACGGGFMAPSAALESGDFEKIEALCQKCVEISLGFSLAHVGINADAEEEALQTAQALSRLFLFPVINKGRSVFAGTAVECMKQNGRGTKGHIGIRTHSVDRAVAYLKAKGIEFAMETAGYDANGSLKYVYLKDEIAGFALHLVK